MNMIMDNIGIFIGLIVVLVLLILVLVTICKSSAGYRIYYFRTS